MTPNVNPETGIRYGVISTNNLDPDVVQELFYGAGAKDLSYEYSVKELRAEAEREADAYEEEVMIAIAETDHDMLEHDHYVEYKIEEMWEERGYDDRDDYVEAMVDRRAEDLQIEEPEIEGEYEGVKYRIGWLGGSALLWVLAGPVGWARSLCSPCVPNAADLDAGFFSGGGANVLAEHANWHECYVVPFAWRRWEDVR